MYIIAIGWMYVVVMMTVAEAISPQGTVLGAAITLVFYGLLPVGIIVYIMGTGSRNRARRAAEAAELEALRASSGATSGDAPDASGHAPGDAVAPERKEV